MSMVPPVDGDTEFERMETTRTYNSAGVHYSVTPHVSPYGKESD